MSKFDKIIEIAKKKDASWQLMEIHRILFEYFSQSPDFEKRGYNLKKGLLLMGGVGTGKTTAMKLFQGIVWNQDHRFGIVNCRHIVRDFRRQGEEIVDKYGRRSFARRMGQDGSGYEQGIHPVIWCIDDLGHGEVISKQYGNESNVIADILLDRYENFQRVGQITHATTNLDPDGFEKIYGARTRDRMREMMNLIVVEGESYRK